MAEKPCPCRSIEAIHSPEDMTAGHTRRPFSSVYPRVPRRLHSSPHCSLRLKYQVQTRSGATPRRPSSFVRPRAPRSFHPSPHPSLRPKYQAHARSGAASRSRRLRRIPSPRLARMRRHGGAQREPSMRDPGSRDGWAFHSGKVVAPLKQLLHFVQQLGAVGISMAEKTVAPSKQRGHPQPTTRKRRPQATPRRPSSSVCPRAPRSSHPSPHYSLRPKYQAHTRSGACLRLTCMRRHDGAQREPGMRDPGSRGGWAFHGGKAVPLSKQRGRPQPTARKIWLRVTPRRPSVVCMPSITPQLPPIIPLFPAAEIPGPHTIRRRFPEPKAPARGFASPRLGWCFLIKVFSSRRASTSVFVTMKSKSRAAWTSGGFGVVVPFLEIAAHAFFQVFCLSDVEHRSFCIFEQVTTGEVRKGLKVDHDMGASTFWTSLGETQSFPGGTPGAVIGIIIVYLHFSSPGLKL